PRRGGRGARRQQRGDAVAAHRHVHALRRRAAAVVDKAVTVGQVVRLLGGHGAVAWRGAAGKRECQQQGGGAGVHGVHLVSVRMCRRMGGSSCHSIAAASIASPASNAKKAAWPTCVHRVPTMPASRLPLKIARNHDATVVAPSRGGASRANRPSPVGRMYSSPKVSTRKNATSHGQPARVPAPPETASTVASIR